MTRTTVERTTVERTRTRRATAAQRATAVRRSSAQGATGEHTTGPRPAVWSVVTSVTTWCATCGTDVEFHAPAGSIPADLAADERACVWCGEALVVSLGVCEERGDPRVA